MSGQGAQWRGLDGGGSDPLSAPLGCRFAAWDGGEAQAVPSGGCAGISESQRQEYLALGRNARRAQIVIRESGRKDKGVCHAGEVPMGKGGLLWLPLKQTLSREIVLFSAPREECPSPCPMWPIRDC